MSEPFCYIVGDPTRRFEDDEKLNLRALAHFTLGGGPGVIFDGTAYNLLNSIKKRTPERTCYIFVDVFESSSGEILVGKEGWRLSLETLLSRLATGTFASYVCWFQCDSSGTKHHVAKSASSLGDRTLLACSSNRSWKFLFSFLFSYLNFGSKLALHDHMSLGHLQKFCLRLYSELKATNETQECNPDFKVIGDEHHVMWNGGNNYSPEVDIENLTGKNLLEERDDALKRVADAVAYRNPSFRRDQKRKNAQAVLWLMEMPAEVVDFPWYHDLEEYRVLGTASLPTKRRIPRELDVQLSEQDCLNILETFVDIPGGTYTVGRNLDSSLSEPPTSLFSTCTNEFKIQKAPVTNALFSVVMNREEEPTDLGNHPATYVSYFDACEFCWRLNIALSRFALLPEGFAIRLPSEVEWEVVASSGRSREYPWGDNFGEGHCNHSARYGGTTPTGKFSPIGDTEHGVSDMSGNVREWTSTIAGTFGQNWSPLGTGTDESLGLSVDAADRIIVRGGSYAYDPLCIRTWVRNTQIACRADGQTGFRAMIGGPYEEE